MRCTLVIHVPSRFFITQRPTAKLLGKQVNRVKHNIPASNVCVRRSRLNNLAQFSAWLCNSVHESFQYGGIFFDRQCVWNQTLLLHELGKAHVARTVQSSGAQRETRQGIAPGTAVEFIV